MKYFGEGLSERHKALGAVIRKPDRLQEAKRLFLDLHAALHRAAVPGTEPGEVDALLRDLKPREYTIMPTARDETIAWALWHIARIEDLTVGMLVGGGEQVLADAWKERLNAPVTDTGNAMTDEEIIALSEQIDIAELLNYRDAVGRRTRDIVSKLSPGDMTRKVSPDALARIREAGGVTGQPESLWLLDFWGGKDAAGLLLMPPTRHVMLHLNACCKWKEHIRKVKR